jgi:type 1 fimbria pilin
MKRFAIAGLGIVASIGLAGGAFAAAGGTSTVTGTLEDSYCYMTMGAHGPSHKKCAMECAEKGIPVSLVEKGAKKIYILLPPKNAESLSKDVISKMEDEVTVTGKEYSKGGVNYLTVESIK